MHPLMRDSVEIFEVQVIYLVFIVKITFQLAFTLLYAATNNQCDAKENIQKIFTTLRKRREKYPIVVTAQSTIN